MRQPKATEKSATSAFVRLQALGDPAIERYIARLHAKFGKYALPAEEVQRIVAEDMGDKTLSDVLMEMRQEGY